MEQWLVTGGAGFIGAHFIKRLLDIRPGVSVVNLDKLTYAAAPRRLDNLDQSRYRLVKGDICDRSLVERLFQEYCFARVVHFAAETHVDRSLLDLTPFYESNTHGTAVLLECAMGAWGGPEGWKGNRLFLQISTDEVYGQLSLEQRPFTEHSPLQPRNPYSASKAAADLLVRGAVEAFGFPAIITRGANSYGPGQYPEKLIPLAAGRLRQGLPVPVYGDGRQQRDWLYVEDHVNALLAVLEKGRPGQIYNIAGSGRIENMVLLETLCRIMKQAGYTLPQPAWVHVEDRKNHDTAYGLDDSKLKALTGWEPRISLEEGLRSTL